MLRKYTYVLHSWYSKRHWSSATRHWYRTESTDNQEMIKESTVCQKAPCLQKLMVNICQCSLRLRTLVLMAEELLLSSRVHGNLFTLFTLRTQIRTPSGKMLLTFHSRQDTKTFPKCYVGRNGKRNQQKPHIQVCGSLKTQRNQGCQD